MSDSVEFGEAIVRPLQLHAGGPLLRVGAIPNAISVDRADWIIQQLRQAAVPYHVVPVPVSGYDRHTVHNRKTYYSSLEQIERLWHALQEEQIDLAVLPLPELPHQLPDDLQLVALTRAQDASYSLVSRREHPLQSGDRVGVFSYSLIRQLRAERTQYHYEQRVYSFEEALSKLEEGIWQGVVLPFSDLVYAELTEAYLIERLSIRRVVPPAGQGALAVVARRSAIERIATVRGALHSMRQEQVYAIEQELEQLLRINEERPGCCIWEEGPTQYLSLYNPEFQRPFQRWAHTSLGSIGTIPRATCFNLLKQVMGRLTLVGIGSGTPRDLTMEGETILRRTEYLLARSSQAEQLYYLLDAPCVIEDLDADRALFERDIWIQKVRQALAQGLRTTILLSGDGYLYSRGAGIARQLVDHQIPFSFVPGINLAITGAARAGVPLLLPGVSPAVHFFDGRDPLLDRQDFRSLRGSIVISSTRRQLPILVQLLLESGLPAHMPTLFLHEPSAPDQQVIRGNLIDFLGSSLDKIPAGMGRGILLLGDSVPWHDRFQNLGTAPQPLAGKTILIPLIREMQAQEQAWKSRWEDEGAHVVLLRLSVVQLLEEGREKLQHLYEQIIRGTLRLPAPVRAESPVPPRRGERRQPLLAPRGRTWLAFLTPEAVKLFFSEFRNQGGDIRQLSGCSIAAMNDFVFRALAAEGVQADLIPPFQTTEGLGLELKRLLKPMDQVVVLRGQGPTTILESILSIANFPVWPLAIYEQQSRLPGAEQLLRLFDDADLLVFLTQGLVEAFAQAMVTAGLGHDSLRDRPIQLLAATLGVKEALEERGFSVSGDLSCLEDTEFNSPI